MLLPSFLMSPVTVVFGAAFSYNVLVTTAPALCATFAYVAFRRWTGRLAALGGALVFGFSPYMVSQSVGHLAQVLTMSAPLLLILLDRLLVVQAGKAWLDGLLLGLLAWAQLLTGEEVLAMEAVTAAIALVVLCALPAGRRGRTCLTRSGLCRGRRGFCGALGPVPGRPVPRPVQGPRPAPAQRLRERPVELLRPHQHHPVGPGGRLRVSSHFTGNGSEQGAYIGIPLALVHHPGPGPGPPPQGHLGGTGRSWRRRPAVHGPDAPCPGHVSHLYLPDFVLQKLPFFHNLLPDRFASMMTLGVGLLVALGLDELKRLRPPGHGRWAGPWPGWAWWPSSPPSITPPRPAPLFAAFYTGFSCPPAVPGTSAAHPPVALVLPVVNELDLRWQAESKFCFAMPSATGMTGTNRAAGKHHGVLFSAGSPSLRQPPRTPAVREQAAQEIGALGIKEIVVGPQSPAQPLWSYQDQAALVAWVQWLVGQAPRQSHDLYISYVWDDLPPPSAIAAGRFARVRGRSVTRAISSDGAGPG